MDGRRRRRGGRRRRRRRERGGIRGVVCVFIDEFFDGLIANILFMQIQHIELIRIENSVRHAGWRMDYGITAAAGFPIFLVERQATDG